MKQLRLVVRDFSHQLAKVCIGVSVLKDYTARRQTQIQGPWGKPVRQAGTLASRQFVQRHLTNTKELSGYSNVVLNYPFVFQE
ncbi:hypothetical protein N9H60_02885 [Flavimaricola sp.]|nr:hypothetical protein [Flavimaricola sp.]MDA9020104.1 hypothetical protein [Flavimaricola sp.]